MPFHNDRPCLFDRQTIESFDAGQAGVYALYNDQEWIYIGRGEIRQRLLDHLNGNIPAINTNAPTHFIAEITSDALYREKQLLREYKTSCNAPPG
jgi:hypothetical protein